MSGQWISLQEMARRLELHPQSASRVAAAADIKRRRLPGLATQFDSDDVARVAAESVIPAIANAESGGSD